MADNNYIQEDDKQLLNRYYAGYNNFYLGILLERYTLLLFGVCMKYLKQEEAAKDAVQQVFVKVIQELPRHKVEFFKSWLYMVAKNHCLMELRQKGKQPQPLPEFGLPLQADETRIDELRDKEVSLQKLEQALPQLNEDQAQCIRLFYLENLSYQQIAESTNFTPGQVKSHIQNGKRNLRIIIERMK